jgi:hypothetical protein
MADGLAEIQAIYARHTARKVALLGGLAVLLVGVALVASTTGAAVAA